MLNQYDNNWKNEKLGTSSSTIGSYGCYLTCICEGLNRHGYSYTPKTLNNLFKQTNTYTGGNLLTSSVVARQNPSLFTSGYNEAWDDNKVRSYLKASDVILIGEVDGRGIGGTGQHFVLILGLVESNGKITNTKIGDPWGGLENLASVRYSKYGYIKSLRVFRVKNKPDNTSSGTSNNGGQMADNSTNNQTSSQERQDAMYNEFLGVENFEQGQRKIIEHVGIKGATCAWGTDEGEGTGGFLGDERRKNKKLEAEITAKNNQVEEAQVKITQAESERDEYKRQVAEKNKTVDSLQVQVSQLRNQKPETVEVEKIVEKQVKVEVSKQTDLDKIATLEAEVSKLKTQLSGTTVSCTQEYVTGLEEQVSSQAKTISKQFNQILQLQQENQELESRSLWDMLITRLKELLS